MKKILDAALEYEQKGMSVIPVRPDKKPFVPWQKYQNERATADQIKSWWEKWSGANVAVVTGGISGLDVIDIDSPKGLDLLNEFIPDGLTFPIARSPRGGWHHYHAHREGVGTKAGILENVDLRGDGGYIIAPPSLGENGRQYAWLEGLSINEVPPCPMPEALYKIINNSIYKGDHTPRDNNRQQPTTSDNIRFDQGYRDNTLFHIANHLVKGGMPHHEIQQFLTVIASKVCDPPFPQKEISAKIQSALKRCQDQEKNLTREIRDLILTTSGNISTTFVYNRQQVTTREEKKKVTVILGRLEKEGLLERTGRIAGEYRIVDNSADSIDFLGATSERFPMKWPFQLEKYVAVYPKNIVMVAGVANSGKTAFALNTARMNLREYQGRIRYESSEMGATELKTRLEKFDLPLQDWKGVDFRERSSNFADVISPNGINIIDFYEISDQFWKIADDLKRIYEKLNKGIAIVCIQKSPGKTEGRGGDFGLEKPRLYLNLDPDPPDGAFLTIRKAKAWAQEGQNPNWYRTRFKIVNGCRLLQQGNWFKETR